MDSRGIGGSATEDISNKEASAGNVIGEPYPVNAVPDARTFTDLLAHMGRDYADRTAFEWADGRSATYAELLERVDERRPQQDSPVVVIDETEPFEFAVALFSAVTTGRVAVLGTGTILTGGTPAVIADPASQSESAPELPAGTRIVLSSSGTTGTAKAVALSEEGVVADLLAGLRLLSFGPEDRAIVLLPPSHGFGLVCDVLGVLSTGGTLCVPTEPRAALAQLARFKPTIMNVPPRFATALRDLLASGADPAHITGGQLRRLLVGGASLDARTSADLRTHGIEALGCYGMSECSPCVAVNRDRWRKDGSAGVPLDCNEVLIDAGAGPQVPQPGESTPVGEVCVHGPNVMLGYVGRPDLTAQVLHNGLLYTGDQGFFDTDGFLHILGRRDGVVALDDGTKRLARTASWKE